MRVKKKPDVLEAYQFTDLASFSPPAGWPGIEPRVDASRSPFQEKDGILICFSQYGQIPVNPGDWIIRTAASGHCFVMSDSAFKERFEEDKP